MPDNVKLNQVTAEELQFLLEHIEPKDLNRSLLEVFFNSIIESRGAFSEKLSEQSMHIYRLVKFLQVAEDQQE